MYSETTAPHQCESAKNSKKNSLRLAATACVIDALAPHACDVETAQAIADAEADAIDADLQFITNNAGHSLVALAAKFAEASNV
jgi:hypothetical protein